MKNNKILNRAIITLMITFAFTACGNTEENKTTTPTPQTQTLQTQTAQTQTLNTKLIEECKIPTGETLTLVDRNDHVDYIIDCTYVVEGSLIVEKNVTIEFGTDAGINVDGGSIQLKGEEKTPIILTGIDKSKGAWKGVIVDSNDVKNEINYTHIDYAGGEAFNSNGDKGAVIIWADSKLKIKNSTITNSETYGINARYGGDELDLKNNTITSCDAPMYIAATYPDTISGGKYIGNNTDAIIVSSEFIAHDATWNDLGVPYHIIDRLDVIEGGKLTVNPGVTMAFGLDVKFFINEGSLIVKGTEDNLITFRAINKVKGGWRGIYFDSPSPLNEIAFANIEYASNPQQAGAIYTWYDTVLNVHNVNFNHIQRDAIHIKKFAADPTTVIESNNNYSDIDGTNVNITN